jgi:hypothetical protein
MLQTTRDVILLATLWYVIHLRMFFLTKLFYFLARQTDIKYGVLDGGSTMNFFKTSNLPVFQTMWEFMSGVERPNVMVSKTFHKVFVKSVSLKIEPLLCSK